MAVQDALGVRLEELRRIEESRRKGKVAALKADYHADDVSLDRIGEMEVALLDKQYVVLELADRVVGAQNVSGPGQGEYKKGDRLLITVETGKTGNPKLAAYRVNDLQELAELALMHGTAFDEMTGSMEMVLSLDKDVLWRNLILNR